MTNMEELVELQSNMVDLYTTDASIEDITSSENMLLFKRLADGEYMLYKGTDDGKFISLTSESAIKLKSTHYIFGQPFNGTFDVSGNMEVGGNIDKVGRINASDNINAKSLTLSGDISGAKNISMDGNLIGAKDISMNGNLSGVNALDGNIASFKELYIKTDTGEGLLIDSSDNKINVGIINANNITVDSLAVKEFTFEDLTIEDVSFNNVSISQKLDTSALHLDSSILTYVYEDENGTLQRGTINFHTGKNNFDLNPITVIYEDVDKLFAAYRDPNNLLPGKNVPGTTYYVTKGISSNNVKDTFIIDNDGKLMPTSPYLVFETSELTDELKIKLAEYNYNAAGTLIIQNAYSKNSNEPDVDFPESTNIEDGTAITGNEYHKLWKAVKQIQYVLGIDMDAGKTDNTTNPDNFATFGLRNTDLPQDSFGINVNGIDSGEIMDNLSEYITTYGKDTSDSSIDGVMLTNLYVNQKTAYTESETEEKPAFLQAIDDIIEEENGEIEDDENVGDDNIEDGTELPDDNENNGVYVPDIYDEITKDIDSISKYFVRAIRIKRGTYTQLMDVSNYILDGELIWCKYDKNYPAQSNKLFIKTTDSRNAPYFYCINTGTNEEDTDDYLTELKDIEKIDWKTQNGSTYRTFVDNEGNMHMQPLTDNTQIEVDSSKTRAKFYINSFYIGGLDSSKLAFRPCSHNYIELSNLTGKDINLEDAKLSLQYTDRKKYNAATGKVTWEILPLKGTIKNGETFLIRGARCAPDDCNTTRIKIDSYDMEWYDSTGKLISFDTECPSIVLYKGDVTSEGEYKTCTNAVDDIWQNNYLYDTENSVSLPGVYDCIGVQGKTNGIEFGTAPLYFENKNVALSYESIKNTYDVLFIKYFAMDNCAQGTIQESSRNNYKDIYLINLNENYEYNLEKFYTGKATYQHKNIFYNKSDIGTTPEMIACSFGKQASDNGNGATRCFNWVSRGYYNEYLELTYPDGTKKYYESFKNSNQNIYTGQEKEEFDIEENVNERFYYKNIYDRYRTFTTSGTPITVHKLIIDNIPAGEYSYKIGRKGFWSEEYTFSIKTDNELIENGFTFIHHSDQQGFNKNEYIAWKRAADFINLKYGDKIDFTVNTGDMTQNGNRISEWLDYYDAGKSLFKHTCQMNTVGNNDLSPADNTVLGTGSDDSKINPKNFDLFYCHDLTIEEQDLLTFEMEDHSFKLLPACYSVDYGNLHLVCINSEVTWMTIERLFNNNDIASKVEEWLDKDFKRITDYNSGKAKSEQKWIITYCHEMPFTILTEDILKSQKREDRSEVKGKAAGCHWNYIPSIYQDGTKHYYWLSRLLEKYHIPLMLGGHKHTYSTSARIKENIKSEADYTNTYKPIIQLNRNELKAIYGDLDDTALKNAWYTTGKKLNTVANPDIFERNICDVDDIEIVDEYDAPMYVMTQATGYKVISNKENAGTVIPWLSIPIGNINANTDAHSQTYYPIKDGKANKGQLYPTFIVWNITKDSMIGLPMKMSTTVDNKTQQIYYTGNSSADGLFRLVNETDYNPNDMENWNPDNVDGMSARKELVLTNKPF